MSDWIRVSQDISGFIGCIIILALLWLRSREEKK